MNTFLEFLTNIWMIGGFLLLPFNSLAAGFLICLKFQLNYGSWLLVVKKLWILQIVWNLLFFSISVFTHDAAKSKITYTLTRVAASRERTEWEYHFYDEKKEEIANGSREATPFQKRLEASNPIGIEDEEGYGVNLKLKLDDLPYEEACQFIDNFNAKHRDFTPFQDVCYVIIFSAICPFLYTFSEAFVIGSIGLIITNPLLGAAIYGPTIYRFWKAGVFKV
jgi:hypothetical protein